MRVCGVRPGLGLGLGRCIASELPLEIGVRLCEALLRLREALLRLREIFLGTLCRHHASVALLEHTPIVAFELGEQPAHGEARGRQ